MRKFVLAVPVVALLLAVGILLTEAGRVFTEPPTAAPVGDASPRANQTGAGWQETGGGGRSGL